MLMISQSIKSANDVSSAFLFSGKTNF